MINFLEEITEFNKDENKLSKINLNFYNKSSIINKIINKYLFDNRFYYTCEIVIHTNHLTLGKYEELYINSLAVCIDSSITLNHINKYITEQNKYILFGFINFKPFTIPQINIKNINFYNYD